MSDDNVMYDAYDEVASLLQGVAHEINNPITVVRTNAQNLQRLMDKLGPALDKLAESDPDFTVGPYQPDQFAGQVQQQIRGIEEAVRRISTVIENFRDFSGTGETKQVPLDLNEVVESSINMTRFHLDKIGSIRVDTANSSVPVHGHKMQLEQVMVNLLTNATHAIEERREQGPDEFEGTIEVTVEMEEDQARVLVSDNGVGIPEEIAESVFAPYVTTKEQGKGFGIGLSKSLGVAREHYGDLYYINSVETGATFVLELPVEEAP